MGSEVAEKDGDLEGVLQVGVSDVESVERLRGNAAGVEDFAAAGLRDQRELEGVEAFASGSEWSDALLHMCHQRAGTNDVIETTNQSNARWCKIGWPPGLGTQPQHLDRWTDCCNVRNV